MESEEQADDDNENQTGDQPGHEQVSAGEHSPCGGRRVSAAVRAEEVDDLLRPRCQSPPGSGFGAGSRHAPRHLVMRAASAAPMAASDPVFMT
jgi:hypothetical protein